METDLVPSRLIGPTSFPRISWPSSHLPARFARQQCKAQMENGAFGTRRSACAFVFGGDWLQAGLRGGQNEVPPARLLSFFGGDFETMMKGQQAFRCANCH